MVPGTVDRSSYIVSVQEKENQNMPLPKVTTPQWLSTLVNFWFIQEVWASLKLFSPIALGFVLGVLLLTTSLIFCGHYPKDTALVLEGAGLGFSILNLTGFLVMNGMGSAMDTLAAQAYGAKNKKKVGVYLQRGLIIHALALLVVLGLWLNLESILNLLHQPTCVVSYTVQFIRGFTFALPALLFYYLLQKFLQVQGIVYPFAISQGIGILVSILAHYLLMFVADLGILGSGIALGISQYAALVILLAFIWICKLHKEAWGGWSWECLNGWGEYVTYGLPGMVVLVAEMAIYEAGILVVGLTGSLQQSILVVLFNYYYILFIVGYSLRLTASVRVGNELGAGNPKGAKRAVFVCLCIAFTWVVIIEVLTLSLRNYIPMIFTSEPTILQAINVHIYIMAVSIAGDALVNTLSGVIVGSGRQLMGAGLNILSFWIVGIPIAASLAIAAHLGALGYMVGEASAAVCMLCIYTVTVGVTNWKKQAEKAQKLHQIQEEKNINGSSPSKDTDKPKEKSSGADTPKEDNEESKATNHNQDTVESSSMQDSPADADSELKDTSAQKDKKFPVSWMTVILRIVTVAIFITLCVGCVVISQKLVYHQAMACNTTTPGNMSGYLPPSQLHAEVLQTMSSNVPLSTKTTGVASTVNHLPLPTPTPQHQLV